MEKLSTSQRSPLSPTLWPADAFSARRCLLFTFALLLALLVGVLGATLTMRAGGPTLHTGKDLQLTAGLLIAQVLAYVPILGVALPLLPYVAQRSLREIGLHSPAARDVRAGVLGGIAMYVVIEAAALVQKFVFHVSGTEQVVQLFGTTHDRALIYGLVALAVFFAPFVEEIIFRGFVFNAVLRHAPVGLVALACGLIFGFGRLDTAAIIPLLCGGGVLALAYYSVLRHAPVGLAALASGVIFGMAHFDKAAFVPLACGGIVLALVYYRTGSLVSSMLSHGAFNAVNVALVLATNGGKG